MQQKNWVMQKIIYDIKKAIELRGISETRLAKMVNVPQSTLNRFLSGKAKRFDFELGNKLQDALGMNADSPIAAADPGLKYGDPLKIAVEEEINKLDRVELADLLSLLLKKARERND